MAQGDEALKRAESRDLAVMQGCGYYQSNKTRWRTDRVEQRRRMCRDGRGLGSKLVSFAKGFSKHTHILAIFKADSEYLRFPFKAKVEYFILYVILVSIFVIFLLLFSMNKRRRTNRASLQ